MKKKLILAVSTFLLVGVAFFAGTLFATAQPTMTSKWVEIFFPNGYKFYKVDAQGKETQLTYPSDMPPIIYNNRFYFSIRALGEMLGYEVDYDGQNGTVRLYENGKNSTPKTETSNNGQQSTQQNSNADYGIEGLTLYELPDYLKSTSPYSLKPITFNDEIIDQSFSNIDTAVKQINESVKEYYNDRTADGKYRFWQILYNLAPLITESASTIDDRSSLFVDASSLGWVAESYLRTTSQLINLTPASFTQELYDKIQYQYKQYEDLKFRVQLARNNLHDYAYQLEYSIADLINRAIVIPAPVWANEPGYQENTSTNQGTQTGSNNNNSNQGKLTLYDIPEHLKKIDRSTLKYVQFDDEKINDAFMDIDAAVFWYRDIFTEYYNDRTVEGLDAYWQKLFIVSPSVTGREKFLTENADKHPEAYALWWAAEQIRVKMAGILNKPVEVFTDAYYAELVALDNQYEDLKFRIQLKQNGLYNGPIFKLELPVVEKKDNQPSTPQSWQSTPDQKTPKI